MFTHNIYMYNYLIYIKKYQVTNFEALKHFLQSSMFLECMFSFGNKLIVIFCRTFLCLFTSGHRRCLRDGRSPCKSRRQRVLLPGRSLPWPVGSFGVRCAVKDTSADHRREEDHALARNRSVIGYIFMLQAGV